MNDFLKSHSFSTRSGRLAPSPTGALHLGNIRTFMAAWLQMRACGGKLYLRIEDLDHPKHKAGADKALMEELAWLGFDWEEEVVWQHNRQAVYEAAFEKLRQNLYPCVCSRADIQRAQSAPHAGEILKYPGTCRTRKLTEEERCRENVAWRFALSAETRGTFVDGFAGEWKIPAAACMGDFVVARGKAMSYALAVVVDDAAMGITDVVRGDDLLAATPAQVVLYEALGLQQPTFFHLPLVVGADGRRLAKRHGDTRIAAFRERGYTPGEILTPLARSCGWLGKDESIHHLSELVPRFTFDTIPQNPFVIDEKIFNLH